MASQRLGDEVPIAASSEGVCMESWEMAVPLPGVIVEGLKIAMAPVGRPVTVRRMGVL